MQYVNATKQSASTGTAMPKVTLGEGVPVFADCFVAMEFCYNQISVQLLAMTILLTH
jgi:hypothetical protein